MSLSYSGKLTIGAITPLTYNAMGEASTAISAQLEGALALEASLTVSPPTVATTLALIAQFAAQLEAAGALGLPSVSFDLSAAASLIASINASYAFLAQLGAVLGDASVGVFAYTYTGAADGLGAAVTTELATQWPDGTPSAGACTAIVLGAVGDANATALTTFLGGA